MKNFFLPMPAIVGLLLSISVTAQKSSQGDEGSYPQISFRTSLTSYLDYDAGIMLGINYRWSKNFSASFEPTWIFYNGLVTDPDQQIFPFGFKIRSDFRYHFDKRNNRGPDFFVAPELHYKYTKTKKEDRFGINCQNGQCAYFQNAVYSELKNEIGGIIKAGLITPLTFISKSDRLLLEMSTGFGIKQLRFKETNLPVGGSFVNLPERALLSIGNQTNRNTYTRPMLPAGFKLIFLL